ncbi:MAG: LysM peptidoglycan-binding domain-containing protein [Ilumatobacteraceae bacterium]
MTASLYPAHRSHRSARHERPGPFVAHVPARVAERPSRATYLRRRVAAVVFLVAVVLAVGTLAEQSLADRGDVQRGASTAGHPSYVVRSGDTLWAIAQRMYPDGDTALIVDALVTLNGGASIQAGQSLTLP